MNCCDKVQEEAQEGYAIHPPFHRCVIIKPINLSHSAHNVISAILKRLAHRNPNVQLYALSLAESLQKNVGIEINREIASKAFTQGLEKIIIDRVHSPLF
jgi:signal transducing adaptor molecule